jgi:hypothetical protein
VCLPQVLEDRVVGVAWAAQIVLAKRKKEAQKVCNADFQWRKTQVEAARRSPPEAPTDSDDDSSVSNGSWLLPLHVQVFSSLGEAQVAGSLQAMGVLPPSRGSKRSLDPRWMTCWTPLPLRCFGSLSCQPHNIRGHKTGDGGGQPSRFFARRMVAAPHALSVLPSRSGRVRGSPHGLASSPASPEGLHARAGVVGGASGAEACGGCHGVVGPERYGCIGTTPEFSIPCCFSSSCSPVSLELDAPFLLLDIEVEHTEWWRF